MPAPRALDRWTPFLALAGLGTFLAVLTLAPAHGECGFLYVVGAPCPGCGMTRSLLALAGGGVGASFRFHPLGPPLAIAAVATAAAAIHEGFTGRPTFRGPAERWGGRAAVAFFVLAALIWIARVVVHPAWSPDPIRPGSPAARLLE